jgi:ubiquitin C-terminal hydrolase
MTVDTWDDTPVHLKELTNQVQDIFDAIRTPNTTSLTPRGFYVRFRGAAHAENMDWLMDGQNDSHECMMFLLDSLHKAVSNDIRETPEVVEALAHSPTLITRGTDSVTNIRQKLDVTSKSSWYHHFGKEFHPVMTNMFHGQFLSMITSREKGNECSFKFEPFSSISLAVPEHGPTDGGPDGKGFISVVDCLDKFFENIEMSGDSKWESPTCGKVNAIRGVRIWRLPDVMILSLKRFTMTGNKIRTPISYPITNLDMSSYCTGDARDTQDTTYDLIGVVIHMGMLFGGHYISIVRNPGGVWIGTDDLRVGRIPIEHVKNHSDAYTLVYQKSLIVKKDDMVESQKYTKELLESKKDISDDDIKPIEYIDAEDESKHDDDDDEEDEDIYDDESIYDDPSDLYVPNGFEDLDEDEQ